ncbi:hypothetical protein FH972_023993 [Carpinus fangiana]|uniref:Raptor N-terminal CASPase-like domain-containing protein n=1 Tax=Carpinus fangiana TaxID=176857 RepID=A0A5N6KWS2_9ROSI|nr:hypothetical protein FH972_023993 [Carpinus fangiana]
MTEENQLLPGVARPPLQRAQSEWTSRQTISKARTPAPDEDDDHHPAQQPDGWQIRHGFEYQNSEDWALQLSNNFYLYFNDKRHDTAGVPKDENIGDCEEDWRMRERLKTVSAMLCICLNIGVDPPDVIKTDPCARKECWTDPTPSAHHSQSGNTGMNLIAKKLQMQYEQLSMRTRYRVLPDPTSEETKKYAMTVRKNAKDERVLFHYNGHGVPRPTPSGEIWVFNKHYTQYIPVSIFDLQTWLGSPALLVYDCSDAGLIIQNFSRALEKHETENVEQLQANPGAQLQQYSDCIQLAACKAGETLPTNPNLPADLFTACLTTPIEMAVRFFILRNPLPSSLDQDDADKIPGRSQERRTPIGELNWIFTAITDTIAWTTLPKALFKKLFRQDLMVAALFRNFLLAQRIMRFYQCHPQCHPPFPSCHDHPLWDSWDLAIESVLNQLPNLIRAERKEIDYEYKHSEFFAEQLTAFQVYLDHGAADKKEPEQLPIVLQVLLSQVHRLRALILLSKFLDLGPWAVRLALGIGIFPYVLKLLQSQATELKPVMVFIWARILAEDQTCQADLLKDNGYAYFIGILNPVSGLPIRDVSEHRAMCAFIIAMFCKDFRQGQMVAHSAELVESCLSQVSWQETDNPLLRQWSCLCLAQLWKDFPEAKWSGIRKLAHRRLCDAAWDIVPEVRAAMLFALTTFIGIPELTDQVAAIEEEIASRVMLMSNDGSSLVRKELVIFFSAFVKRYTARFTVAAYEQMIEEKDGFRNLEVRSLGSTPPDGSLDGDVEPVSTESIVVGVWKQILVMSCDPDPEVSRDGKILTDYVLATLHNSPLGPFAQPVMTEVVKLSEQFVIPSVSEMVENHRPLSAQGPISPTTPNLQRTDSYFSLGMRRTASVAASLKNLAFGPSTPTEPDLSPSRNGSMRAITQNRLSGSAQARLPANWTNSLEPVSTLQANHPPTKSPVAKHYKERSQKAKQQLPLKSTFFDWSVEYFREPQMKQNEADEPGSEDYNVRLWRRNRNEKILDETQRLKDHAGKSRWDKSSGFFDNRTQPMKMCFHQYDPHLAVTDDHSTVRIWDWEAQKQISKFSNGNPLRTRITGTRFINEDDRALLMTGSSDGCVRLYRDYDSVDGCHLVSSFSSMTDIMPSTRQSGLVFDWLQGRGEILVAGDAKVIRVWSAMSEVCKTDIPARSGSCVTSLTSDQVEGNIFVAGFGDGAVRVYDQREKPMKARIQQWKEHTSWITDVHMQRGGQRELLSGSTNGEVKLWDIRMGKSLKTIRATRDSLRSLSVHEHAPVFATGSERHNVKVHNMHGDFLSSFEPYASFLQQNRSSPIATTAFHPHRLMLACAAINDSHVNLFSCAEPHGEINGRIVA